MRRHPIDTDAATPIWRVSSRRRNGAAFGATGVTIPSGTTIASYLL
jgi:hypothetical protein